MPRPSVLSPPALIVTIMLFIACAGRHSPPTGIMVREGAWRFSLSVPGGELPFLADLALDSSWHMTVYNGDEHIPVDEVRFSADSVRIHMPLFDSEFRGRVENDSTIKGLWFNYLKGGDYHIPFEAHAGHADRFPSLPSTPASVSGTWEAHFSLGTPDAYDAIGLFQQNGEHLSGTFGTETGDYRYLDGVMSGDSLYLSCFDGSHAFLFHARLQGDSLVGRFWSGSHWQEPWFAIRNPTFALRDPDSLTFLREGYDMVDFRFPSIDGGTISPKDLRFQDKVLIVQIMGSWCPNCVDETRLLTELYHEYHGRGLEVIAVAFEKHEREGEAYAALEAFRTALDIPYTIVYAGNSGKDNAAKKLPFLDHVMSFPTAIFIDRKGMVRRIRTGFYGPGTGEHYLNYKHNLTGFVEGLLSEERPHP
ncbi:MAG: TlpA family protein disulfide reductase [Flavobacteriales bacterium]|nr:TlpA family protein disulfide reductase [Flavobacteriales bacterium]MCB9167075.1 TlpA family protein disulfide reductase [Flavobacteriales bacterium]